jgi:hypothetical protein
MNMKNESMGFSLFQLHIGRFPKIIPLLIIPNNDSPEELKSPDMLEFMEKMKLDTDEAKDVLLMAKIQQTFYANKMRNISERFKIDDKVMLSTSQTKGIQKPRQKSGS